MRFRKIYILNDAKHEYGACLNASNIHFEELIFITETIQDIFNIDKLKDRMLNIMIDASNEDAVIVNGPIILALVLGIIISELLDRPKILLFSANQGTYKVRSI